MNWIFLFIALHANGHEEQMRLKFDSEFECTTYAAGYLAGRSSENTVLSMTVSCSENASGKVIYIGGGR